MKRWMLTCTLIAILVSESAHATAALTPVQTISLPNVAGRIDHLAVDLPRQRLFIAALGNHSIEVIDARAGLVTQEISGLGKPQGIAYLPDSNRLVVADGALNRVDIFDGLMFRLMHRVDSLEDADNVRVDAATGLVYIGYGNGGLKVLNGKDGVALRTIPLAAHPEAFEIDPSGDKIYINVPEKRQITVIDQRRGHVMTNRKLESVMQNFPMALDSAGHRLFVGTRHPARLQVYDVDNGKLIAQLPIGADSDDIFFDNDTKRVYVICGEGVVDVIHQIDADHYATEAKVATRRGARTGLLVPMWHRLFVALPRSETQDAEIRAFTVSP